MTALEPSGAEEFARPPFATFRRIDEPIGHWAAVAPGAPALAEGDRVLSYAALEAETARAVAALADEGVGPGDRVLILLENGLAAAVLGLAAVRLGAWMVPVNARLSAREVAAIREHARPRLSVYTTGVSSAARAHAARDGARSHRELAGLGAACRVETAETTPAREPGIAALLYTSGTTGAPKAVMLGHDNLLFMAARTSAGRRTGPGVRVYGVLPISHVYGLSAVLLGSCARGARLDLVPRFEAACTVRALEQDGITIFQAVPAIYSHILQFLESRGTALAVAALRYISVGGAPLDLTLKRRVEAAFGLPLHNGYGLTETSPTVCITPFDTYVADDTVGLPHPDVEVRIVDAGGRDLPEGQVGEFWVRGGLVMRGYYRDPAQTAEVLTPEGWFKTGDLGRRGADGMLYIVGRKKDLIIRSGFNVYPVEVESVIAAHPEVALTAVLGRPCGDGNEEVVAFVQPRAAGALDLGDLGAFVAARLAPYKRPAEYLLRENLPTTAAGKILKHKLKKELQVT